jgi:3-methyladenine DNA glycosylase AlkD
MKETSSEVQKELKSLGTPERAKTSLWYFKTDPGQYGEGDIFYGVSVPDQRKIAKKYSELPLPEITKLLKSKYHESRLTALFILVLKYRKGADKEKQTLAKYYISNKKYINNWDLVDSSAPYIYGHYLLDKDKKVLHDLARSPILWDRRIAILSSAWFIREGNFEDTLKLAKILLDDKEDLIHKAVGWMLREIGKKSPVIEEKFLEKYYKQMPRTMLRYAVERFPEEKRKKYLQK